MKWEKSVAMGDTLALRVQPSRPLPFFFLVEDELSEQQHLLYRRLLDCGYCKVSAVSEVLSPPQRVTYEHKLTEGYPAAEVLFYIFCNHPLPCRAQVGED